MGIAEKSPASYIWLASAADFIEQLEQHWSDHDSSTLGSELLQASVAWGDSETVFVANPEEVPRDVQALTWALKQFIPSVEEKLSSVVPTDHELAAYKPAVVRAA